MRIALIIALVWFSFLVVSCEQEWTIKIDDCREKITIKESSFKSFFGNFTCEYSKTSKWDIIYGYCKAAEIIDNVCIKATTYEKSPTIKCWKESHLNLEWVCINDKKSDYSEKPSSSIDVSPKIEPQVNLLNYSQFRIDEWKLGFTGAIELLSQQIIKDWGDPLTQSSIEELRKSGN